MKYWMIVMGIFGLDTAIKDYIEEQEDVGKIACRPDCKLLIRKSHNTGMAMNLGDKYPHIAALLSVLITVIITLIFIITLGKKGNAMLRTGLSFLLGGAYSNTCDRLRRNYVVDYVSFNVPVKRLRNIVFNIADFAIMAGSLLIIISQMKKKIK